MTIGYLILAHQNLAQVERLISALKSDHTKFYVHVDKKCTETLPNDDDSSKWISKHDIAWGSFSMVLATMNLLTLARQTKIIGTSF